MQNHWIDRGIDKSLFDVFPNLESERLLFRKMEASDVEDVFAIFSDPEVAKYDFFTHINTKEKALLIIDNYQDEFISKEEITWGIIRKDDNKLIGYFSLGNFDEDAKRCEIGYGLNRDVWNKGYGTEAIKTITKFAFEKVKVNRIEATVTFGNDASVKALIRSGFLQEGILRERTMIKGELVDDVILALIRRDYII
ncbi:GNAT family N-acetyltransferase [Clostridium fungisolvens]|uniref:IS1595 family transposase ISSpgl1 n=1 Tax=Clostridium fungisolvens TaxID=1604897 RepID=A0A6V8SG62_9CLOT|nr:GNAT family N-acetyltransferase [Clostridium fungisolvens]GFP76204.1 IS1595 family transposase ISSpgl1 [Clostridium fungisolvens]